MAVGDEGYGGDVRLRPRRGLLWSGVFVLVIVPLPVVATLITLGMPNGSWPIARIGGVISIVVFFIGLHLFRTTEIVISATQITERGFFSRTVCTPISAVNSLVLVHTFSISSSETLPQLIVRNDRNDRILRMRGAFWSEQTMREAAAAIGSPLEEPVDALTSRQFFEQYSGSAYWFENQPALGVAIAAVIGLACIGGVLGLMSLLGLPLAG